MPKGIFRDSSPLTKLTLSGTIIIISLLLFYSIGILIVKLKFHANIEDLGNNGADEFIVSHAAAFKLFQILQSIGLFILPPFIIGYLIDRDAPGYLHLKKRSTIIAYIIVPFIMVASIPFINFLVSFNEGIQLPSSMKSLETWMKEGEKNAEALTKVFLQANNFKDLVSNLLLIALLPAVGEELLFRGVLQKQFSELAKNHHIGIWIAAFLFSFMHFQFSGFIPRLILGVLLGYIFYFSKSLWLPIIAHFTNNAMAVIFYYLYATGQVNKTAEEIGTQPGEIYVAFLSLAVTGALLFGLFKTEKRLGEINSSQ
jgi:membrane protease YdiL (CAAX protease family)